MEPREHRRLARRIADNDREMLRLARTGAKRGDFGLLRHLERHAGARNQFQRINDGALVIANFADRDRSCAARRNIGRADDNRRQQSGTFGQPDRRGLASRQRLPDWRKRPLERLGQIGRGVGNGAELAGVERHAKRERDDIGRVHTDLERTGALMGEHKPRFNCV